MRKEFFVVVLCVVGLSFLSGCFPVGMIKDVIPKGIGLPDGAKGGGGDFKAIENEAASFIANLRVGFKSLFKSASLTLRAAGLDKEAQRLELIEKELEKDPDLINDKEWLDANLKEINLAVEKVKDVAEKKQFDEKKAKKYVVKGIVWTGVAVHYDTIAVKHAKNLIQSLPNAIQSNPIKAIKLKKYLSLAKFAIKNVPVQLNKLKDIGTNLKNYATEHGISLSDVSGQTQETINVEDSELENN